MGLGRALRATWGRLRQPDDAVIAWLLGVGTVFVLVATASQGFVRDEGYYFRAAREYHSWFEGLWRHLWEGRLWASFADAELRRAFGYNTEHPGLVKLLMGWTWKIFHHALGWTSASTGFRLGAIAVVAVGNAFTFLLGARLFGRPVGLLAVVLLLACPHVFFHAHLACFDGPIMALTVVTTYALLRSLESPRWCWGAGLAWGLAVATKHNAVFLLPTLAMAYAIAHGRQFGFESGGRLRLPPIPAAFVAMVLLGPVLLYLTYPYGWHDPIARLGAYYGYHLNHEHYPVDYLGTLYYKPPFPIHFPLVMSALTVPLPVLLCGLLGFAQCLGRAVGALRERRADVGSWLLVVSVVVPPAIIALPTVPIFGGTKHWMPMMPFFVLLAASVVWQAVQQMRASATGASRVLAGALLAMTVALPLWETVRTHPLGHTYFNELAGGHQGGAALGMPRTFWGGDGRELLGRLNALAESRATVFTDRMNYYDFRAYQTDGLLRSDLRWVREVRQADWAIINHQREYRDQEYRVWSVSGSGKPEAVVAFDGVAITSLYRVRGRP